MAREKATEKIADHPISQLLKNSSIISCGNKNKKWIVRVYGSCLKFWNDEEKTDPSS